MKKAVLLVVLAVAVSLTSSPAFAAYCSASCGSIFMECTATSCSGTDGSQLTCNGTTTTCSQASSWCACSADCLDQCSAACELSPGACGFCINNCHANNCGSQPPFISHC